MRSIARLRAVAISQATGFSGARSRGRNLPGDLDRLVQVVGFDQVEAAQVLLRLGEGTVGRQRLAVVDPDGCRLREISEIGAALRLWVTADRHVLLGHGLLLCLAELLPASFFPVDQECVLHVVSLLSMSRLRRTGYRDFDIANRVRRSLRRPAARGQTGRVDSLLHIRRARTLDENRCRTPVYAAEWHGLAGRQHPLEQGERAGLVEWLIQVAALGALDAGRAAGQA